MKTCWTKFEQTGVYYTRKKGKGQSGNSRLPAYKIAIIDRAVALLKAAEGNTLSKKELFDAVVDLYPKKSKNNIYKIFDADPSFVKTGAGKGDSYSLAPGSEDA